MKSREEKRKKRKRSPKLLIIIEKKKIRDLKERKSKLDVKIILH